MDVAEFTVNVAEFEPNFTDETFVNPVPVMVTELPPAVEPELGEIPVTVGALA
jgi:hypothetical protein